MLHPDAQAQIDRRKAELAARLNGTKPLMDSRFGVRTIGALAEITPGVEVWCVEGGRRNWHEQPLGGLVLTVDGGGPGRVDDETGEIVRSPARYRCYDHLAPWPGNAFRWISESEISSDTVEVADRVSLVTAVRRFCRQVGTGPRVLDAHEAQLVTDAARIVAVLMGGGIR
jgi:hypothetical protein